jgi:hypothetical protein
VKHLIITENKADRTSLGGDVQALIPKQVILAEGDSEVQKSNATEIKSDSVVLG